MSRTLSLENIGSILCVPLIARTSLERTTPDDEVLHAGVLCARATGAITPIACCPGVAICCIGKAWLRV